MATLYHELHCYVLSGPMAAQAGHLNSSYSHSYSQHVLTLAGHYLQGGGAGRNCKKALKETCTNPTLKQAVALLNTVFFLFNTNKPFEKDPRKLIFGYFESICFEKFKSDIPKSMYFKPPL